MLLKKPYITLHQMDMSPAILRVDRIKSRTDVHDGAKIIYGNGREYRVKENCFQIGELINEVTKN